MVKLIGTVLIVGCCTLLGLGVSARSGQRIRSLRSLIDSLERLKGELESLLTPLPELLILLTKQAGQPASELYSNVSHSMEQRKLPFRIAWEQGLAETESLCLRPEENRALSGLGSVLGRSDVETQAAALSRCHKQLTLFLELEEREKHQKGRVSAALGAGAGITLALLLL